MSDNVNPKELAGCAVALWSLLVTTPMWLFLIFALMSANQMPNWSWVLYWCYVPACILGVFINSIFALIKNKD